MGEINDFQQGILYFEEAVGNPMIDHLDRINSISRICQFFIDRKAKNDAERVIQLSNEVLAAIPSDNKWYREFLFFLSRGLIA